jgi:hypothetical protein
VEGRTPEQTSCLARRARPHPNITLAKARASLEPLTGAGRPYPGASPHELAPLVCRDTFNQSEY